MGIANSNDNTPYFFFNLWNLNRFLKKYENVVNHMEYADERQIS